jgi:predicted lipid-binding transport protein (Tim44 family)
MLEFGAEGFCFQFIKGGVMKGLFSIILAGVMVFGAMDASAAKRLGGGKSVGQQSSNVTQREAVKTPPATPTQNAGTSAAAGSPAAAGAAAAAPKKPWGAMLGGLAAGLGLAWLASSLGFGEAFGQILLFLLLGLVVMVVVGMIVRSRRNAAAPQGLALQGAGGAPAGAVPRSYSPEHVGNDASARPWERSSTSFDASRYAPQTGGSLIGSGLGGSQAWGVPADFDTAGFVTAAKRNFVTLQDAWDRADIATLRAMMTDSMLEEIRAQLSEREKQAPGQPNRTEVVMLEAQLLGISDSSGEYMASVEFNGMIREDPSAGPSPFREVWNMTKPKDGSGGWLVAGVQALQ